MEQFRWKDGLIEAEKHATTYWSVPVNIQYTYWVVTINMLR